MHSSGLAATMLVSKTMRPEFESRLVCQFKGSMTITVRCVTLHLLGIAGVLAGCRIDSMALTVGSALFALASGLYLSFHKG